MTTIYVVSAEARPYARRTGLGEFGGLVRTLADHPSKPTVQCLLPNYPGMKIPAAEPGSDAAFVPVGEPFTGVTLTESGRFEQPLTEDCDCDKWDRFATAAVAWIEGRGKEFYLLALDWPAALVADRLSNHRLCKRVTFTADLVPQSDTPAYDMWREGVRSAHTIHLPTVYWRDYLRRERPDSPLFADEARIRCLRYGFETTSYQPRERFGCPQLRRLHPKDQVQANFGLKRDLGAMVVVAVNRWDPDDQKGNRVIHHYAEELLALRPGQIQLVIGNTSHEYPGDDLVASYRAIGRTSGCVAVGGMDWPDLLAGADLQLMPSRFEPYGLNHAQGMAMGVVPLCSRTGCMGEPPMADGVNAFLFDWNDADWTRSSREYFGTLTDAVKCYFENRTAWAGMVHAATEAAGHFSWGRVADEYLEMICAPRVP